MYPAPTFRQFADALATFDRIVDVDGETIDAIDVCSLADLHDTLEGIINQPSMLSGRFGLIWTMSH